MTEIDPLNADFARLYPEKFARILGRGTTADIAQVLNRLPPAIAASIVARLPVSRIAALLSTGQQSRWLTNATLSDAKTLLGRMPREQCLALVNTLHDRERRRQLLQYLKYPAHSVGALVTDVPVWISADLPAADVLLELRALESEHPGLLVVAHPDGRYLGLLDLWPLLAQDPPPGPIRDYTQRVPPLHAETSVVSAVQSQSWHVHNWLPVVDHEQRILGGVSRSSVFQAAGPHVNQSRRGNDVLLVLVADFAYVSGKLLERLLSNRSAR